VRVAETDEQRIARLQAELAELERRYAEAEERKSGRSAATARRGPISLIAVCLGVALSVGVVAAIDLRRLQTPTGTALAWTGAAVFGDCTAYRELSAETGDEPDADARCRTLREATELNRAEAGRVAIEVVEVAEDGDRARATVVLQRPERDEVEVEVPMRRTGDGWQVELTDEVCDAVGCA
jgi:hypothetical protein